MNGVSDVHIIAISTDLITGLLLKRDVLKITLVKT